MKKRYYILLALTVGFMFAGAVTWGGLAGTGGVQEMNPFNFNSISIEPKIATWFVEIGHPTATTSCASAYAGAIMLSPTPDNLFYGCNGSDWVKLDTQ